MLTAGIVDLARGKNASVSSLSVWSRGGADSVLQGESDLPFGFHTELEDAPWWQVDLGIVAPLIAIVVHNRRDMAQDRARSLKVQISENGCAWVVVHCWALPFRSRARG